MSGEYATHGYKMSRLWLLLENRESSYSRETFWPILEDMSSQSQKIWDISAKISSELFKINELYRTYFIIWRFSFKMFENKIDVVRS